MRNSESRPEYTGYRKQQEIPRGTLDLLIVRMLLRHGVSHVLR